MRYVVCGEGGFRKRWRVDGWRVVRCSGCGLLRTDPAPVLDIGTGAGHLVAAARSRGIEMDGMDPSGEARKVARDVYGLELLSELPTDGEYAAATLIHVVEHMRDPVAELARVRKLLRSEGNLHHFNPRTLSMVLDRAGFMENEKTLVNTRPVERMLMHKSNRDPGTGAGARPAAAPRLEVLHACRPA